LKVFQNFLTKFMNRNGAVLPFAALIRNDKALAEELPGGADFSPRRRSLKGKETAPPLGGGDCLKFKIKIKN
jgi:hypothetical protein